MTIYKTGYDNALDTIMSGDNTVIVGEAGTGKSLLIHNIMQFFESDTILAASSGIAARNIGGTTAHSAFRLPIGFDTKLPFLPKEKKNVLNSKYLSRIILDESFMLRADSFDHIDQRLRQVRRNPQPFGGLQVVVIGDPLQLPPILQSKTQERAAYMEHYKQLQIFGSHVWEELDYTFVEMDKVLRQENTEFSGILGNIRRGVDVQKSIEFINDSYNRGNSGNSIILATTRKIVGDYNQLEFNKLKDKVHTYHTKAKGKTSDMQIEPKVDLKVGSRVIITYNDPNGAYFNGSLGVATKLGSDSVDIQLDKGQEVTVPFIMTPCYEYRTTPDGRIKKHECGSVTYMPLMLGWSITTHRSQGLTLDSMNVDMGYGAFCAGQTYVALSRVKSLEGLYMKRPLRKSDIIVDQEAISWLNSVRK